MLHRKNHYWLIVAPTLLLTPNSAVGQTASNAMVFPIDPYAQNSSTSQNSDLNSGFSVDPFAGPANQDSNSAGATDQNNGLRDSATTANTGAGEVGQRQTAADSTIEPNTLYRVNTRIQNRVENRLRNRIDRNYDPTANSISPFVDAQRNRKEDAQPR